MEPATLKILIYVLPVDMVLTLIDHSAAFQVGKHGIALPPIQRRHCTRNTLKHFVAPDINMRHLGNGNHQYCPACLFIILKTSFPGIFLDLRLFNRPGFAKIVSKAAASSSPWCTRVCIFLKVPLESLHANCQA